MCHPCRVPLYFTRPLLIAIVKTKTITLLLACVILVSCQQTAPKFYGTFSAQDKTIAVPTLSNTAFVGALKDRLRQDGWRIAISGATAKEGVEAHVNRSTKYTLSVKEITLEGSPSRALYLFPVWGQVAWLVSGVPALRLSDTTAVTASIYENKSGLEIMNYTSKEKNCEKAADQVADAIKAHTK